MSILRNRVVYAALWVTLLGYALFASPPPAEDFVGEVAALALADTTRVDAIAIAVFNLLGVLPTAFLAILLFDPRPPEARSSPWPFALGAYLLGGVVLLPYLVLRDTRLPLVAVPGRFVSAVGSRVMGWILLATAVGLVGFGILFGSPAAFAEQFAGSKLVAVMSLDLAVLVTALHLSAAQVAASPRPAAGAPAPTCPVVRALAVPRHETRACTLT